MRRESVFSSIALFVLVLIGKLSIVETVLYVPTLTKHVKLHRRVTICRSVPCMRRKISQHVLVNPTPVLVGS